MKLIHLLLFFVLGCTHPWEKRANSNAKKSTASSVQPVTVLVQPFKGTPAAVTNRVYQEIKHVYPFIKLNDPVSLPSQAYYKPKNRYRADSIIHWLAHQAEDHQVYLGLTTKDISTTKGSHPDWGVMGLGYSPGKACVISSFRLHKDNVGEEIFKVSIHELGHTMGLTHCPVSTCYMQDAEGKNVTDMMKGFCAKCSIHLRSKGWKV